MGCVLLPRGLCGMEVVPGLDPQAPQLLGSLSFCLPTCNMATAPTLSACGRGKRMGRGRFLNYGWFLGWEGSGIAHGSHREPVLRS